LKHPLIQNEEDIDNPLREASTNALVGLIKPPALLVVMTAYTLGDGRKVMVTFTKKENETYIEIKFEAESTHSIEMQCGGWQSILDNFKKYVEAQYHDKI
jgi:hypothetical protein